MKSLHLPPVTFALATLVAFAAPGLVPGSAGAAVMQGSFSIIGLDRASGAIGIAVVSDAPACGADVPWVEAGVGAVATSGEVNPGWGPRGLALLRAGIPPQAVCDSLYRNDPHYLRRQVGVLDAHGQPGGYTGLELIGYSGGVIDTFCAVTGNSLSYTDALMAARDSFVALRDEALPDRLLAVLGFGATKARGPLRSAALLVGRADPERPLDASRWIDLRVDDSDDPVGDLARLYRDHCAARLVESHLHRADGHRRAGAAALAASEQRRGEALIARALADTSLHASALAALAWHLAQRGEHLDAARQAVDRALAREPKNRSFLDTATEVAVRRGDTKAALDYAQRAFAAAPRDEYLFERAKVLGGASPPAGGK